MANNIDSVLRAARTAERNYSRNTRGRKGKQKNWVKVLIAIIVVVVAIFGYLKSEGFFDKKIIAESGQVVLQPGLQVQASSEAAECGYEDYTWLGYTESERVQAECLVGTLTLSEDMSNEPKYVREDHFGPAWQYDYDSSGCNTRDDILRQVLTQADVNRCTVFRGIYPYDPYTGDVDLVWDKSSAASLQVDHIVALKDVWISGAKGYSADDVVQKGIAQDPFERRQQVANDPLNLVLADGPENMSKSSSKANDWMVPLNAGYRCEYSARQVMVKSKYGLAVTKGEKKALEKQLSLCEA